MGAQLWLVTTLLMIFFSSQFVSLLILLAYIVFFQQSIWYSGWDNPVLSIYEYELANFKFIEIIVTGILVKAALTLPQRIRIPKSQRYFLGSWVFVIAIGISVAWIKQKSAYDMFVFSEFRTLLLGMLTYVYLCSFCRDRKEEILDLFLTLVVIKIVLVFSEYLAQTPLMWQANAENYSGIVRAFFGGDADVAVTCLAACWSITKALNSEEKKRNRALYFVAGLLVLVIFMSLRRGGILAIGISVLSILYFSHNKYTLHVAALASITAGLITIDLALSVGFLPDFLYATVDRFLGRGVSAISNMGHIQDIKDAWVFIESNWLFGGGAGARIESLRPTLHGADATASIFVHQNILHTWVKYGVIGVLLYLAHFTSTIKHGWTSLRTNPGATVVIVAVSFLIGKFVWELFIPPFYQSFRQTFLFFLAVFLISTYSRKSPIQPGSMIAHINEELDSENSNSVFLRNATYKSRD
ncbi:MAG: O-antigen ligase family protein [Halieaceae bacterium]